MTDYQLYCFAQSGNAYRAALMLNLIGAKWEPIWTDFFGAGVQRTPGYRTDVNEIGEVPVLVVSTKKLTQSGVILTYLARKSFAKPAGDPAVLAFLQGRAQGNLAIVNKRLTGRQYLVSDKPTIADVSMTAYLYYPAEEYGFDIAKDHPAIGAWLERMKALPGWKHPYDLMPGYPFGTSGYRNQ